jgi:gas vesicle protein GvpO
MAQDEERKDDDQDELEQDEEQNHESGEESSDDSGGGSGDGDSGDDSSDDDSSDDSDDDSDSDDSDSDDSDDDTDTDSPDASPSLSAKEMTQAALEALRELTGHEPESATGLMWDGDAWLVTVDVLELRRIPNTTDLLGTYVVQLDGEGNLSGYKRTRRFQRGQAEEG